MRHLKVLPKTIVISVTKKDIESGTQGSCSMCPIAIALRRKFKADYVRVGDTESLVGLGTYATGAKKGLRKHTAEYNMPDEASQFIYQFDGAGKKDVDPAKFTLWRTQ